MLPPTFFRMSSHASARFIEYSIANISMWSHLNSLQDCAVNAWKKEIFHQMNMFQFDYCLMHIPIPSSMLTQSWAIIQLPRRYSNSKAHATRLRQIFPLFSIIFNLPFQVQLKTRSPLKRRSSLSFRLVTKICLIPLSRSRKLKSFKNLWKAIIITKSNSNNSSITNIHKHITTLR